MESSSGFLNSRGDRQQKGVMVMEWLFGVGVMAGMLVLRLAVPVALMLAVTYGLHRLDARWQAQAHSVTR
jgi:hypothetical protein